MDHIEYIYTDGLDEERVDQRLRDGTHGVLAVAKDNEAYAVPLNYFYDGSTVFLRVSDEPDSTKVEYIESTDTATFVVYESTDEKRSWSVMIRGKIRRLPEDEQDHFTDARLNEAFPPFRLFDEAVPDVEMLIYALTPTEITGRGTVE